MVKDDKAAVFVGGAWYLVDGFENGSELAQDYLMHLVEKAPTIYRIRGPLNPAEDDRPRPSHVVLDPHGGLVPLGVLTQGGEQ